MQWWEHDRRRMTSSNRTVVAIHQPNFYPWLGFFDKIRRADRFIALDCVQYSKGSWTNRVKIMVAGGPMWITVPVVRNFHGTKTIADMQIDNHLPWRAKLLKTIALNYRRAPHFEQVYKWIADLIADPTDRIVDYNMRAIRATAIALDMDDSKLVMGSSLGVDGRATSLLVSMVRAVHGDAYLAGGGAGGYQDDEMFADAGLAVKYQDFQHPVYRQFNSAEFVPGLSVVDALMNCGFQGTADLLSRGKAE